MRVQVVLTYLVARGIQRLEDASAFVNDCPLFRLRDENSPDVVLADRLGLLFASGSTEPNETGTAIVRSLTFDLQPRFFELYATEAGQDAAVRELFTTRLSAMTAARVTALDPVFIDEP